LAAKERKERKEKPEIHENPVFSGFGLLPSLLKGNVMLIRSAARLRFFLVISAFLRG
jgi:hypothetical protein